MDCSKEYILMCDKAEEIQNLKRIKYGFELKYGDYYTTPDERIKICLYSESPKFDLGSGMIFLPRQDQLQEMVEGSLWSKVDNLKHELDMCVNRVENITLEKAWLFYVMRRKYDKTWSGKEWVKTQEGKS